MVEIAQMCFFRLLHQNYGKRYSDVVMLHELLLSNDLYSSQENLEGDQLQRERQFWRYTLGDLNYHLSAQQL